MGDCFFSNFCGRNLLPLDLEAAAMTFSINTERYFFLCGYVHRNLKS